MGRRTCSDKRELKKGHWSPEEDKILSHFIHKYGPRNWRELSKKSGLLRCGKSCRLRWINYLRPDIKRGGFTSQEEAAIIQLHKLLGNRWSRIAACFPGRTDNEIKNVWNTKLKKRVGNDQSVISLDVCMQDSTSINEISHANNLSFLPFPSQQNDSADFPTSLFYDTHNMSTEIFQPDCIHSSIDCREQHSSTVADDLVIDETFVLEDEETWLQPRQNQNMNTYNEVLCEGGSSIEAQYLMDAYLEDDLLSCMDSADTYHKASDDGSDCTDYWFNTLCQIQPPPVL